MRRRLPTAATAVLLSGLLFSICAGVASAHEHHPGDIPEGQGISNDPIDSILWVHIFVQAMAWGLLYPIGMVLGLIRSRWHVPVQVFSTCLAVLGYFLGHAHKGRQFAAPNAHGTFAPILHTLLATQILLGIYLKLHLERGIHGRIRWFAVRIHGLIGKLLPVAAWTQMLFGGITAQGFCRGDHLGQCLAHFIMGSAFIGYGLLLVIAMLAGQRWIARTGRSQEFFDSLVIAAWGCVNTFTEHRWGSAWVHNDLQHTAMGIVWWCAGLLGMWLSRDRRGRPRRNLVPALTIILTGYAMSAHPQTLMISNMTHKVFGYTLMAAGLTRGIEISFLLRDKPSLGEPDEEPSSFQYLPPFLLVASGYLFMGATEEQMKLLDEAKVDHVSYLLILYSVAFLTFLFANILLHLAVAAGPADKPVDNEAVTANGRVRDANEFELHGLADDDDEDEDEDNAELDIDAELDVDAEASRLLKEVPANGRSR